MSLLEVLIYVVRFPYEAGKELDEDRKSRRFWKWFAWVATGIILAIPLALGLWWLIFPH